MDLPNVAGVEFREVVGFPGYAVGDDGTVWSCRKAGMGFGTFGPWKHLRPVPMRNGYMQVFLRQEGKTVKRLIHEVVLTTFVRQKLPGEEGCHFPDRTRSNNALKNLRWDTHKGNDDDKAIQGTKPLGDSHHNSKLTCEAVKEIRRNFLTTSVQSFAIKFGVSPATIQDAAHGRTWNHVTEELAK